MLWNNSFSCFVASHIFTRICTKIKTKTKLCINPKWAKNCPKPLEAGKGPLSQVFLCHAVCVFCRVRLFATPWTVTLQAPLSMGFSRQEYWSGVPFPSPRDPPDPGIKLAYSASPARAGRFFYHGATWETQALLSHTYSSQIRLI